MTIQPSFPIYIPSKGRADKQYTAKMFMKDQVDFHIVIEPNEVDNYREYADKLLVLPKNNQGLVYSRNWIKEYSVNQGEKRHWQFDDDIEYISRLYKGYRIRCQSNVALKISEDFVERYENVALASLNAEMFIPVSKGMTLNSFKWPPFYLNQRCYTCFLMLNSLPNQWRYRYNEDTDMTLQVLADGWCTILFNAFLIATKETMLYAGGQTAIYVDDGRLQMSRQLERVWPGVVETRRRFGRPQHYIKGQWNKFDTQLIPRKDIDWDKLKKSGPNEYGLTLKQVAPEIQSDGVRKLLRSCDSLKGVIEDMNKRNQKMKHTGEGFHSIRPLLFVKVARTASESLSRLFKDVCINYMRIGGRAGVESITDFYKMENCSDISVCHNHLPIQYLKKSGLIPNQQYELRLKCAFIRNPWDRLASFWRLYKNKGNLPQGVNSFKTYVRDLWKRRRVVTFNPNSSQYLLINPQWRWILPDFDFIGRYEKLAEDVTALGQLMGKDNLVMRYHTKMHHDSGKERKSYLEMYDDESADWVAEMYADDLAIFGYTSIDDKEPNTSKIILRNLKKHWSHL